MDRPIAVIDDEPDVLELLIDILEVEGFPVVSCGHPRQFRTLARDHDPCIFLLDIMLPGISGIELAAELRAASFPTTPMIALSASVLLADQARASGLFQGVLTKPFNVDHLVGLVRHFARTNGACRGMVRPSA